MNHLELQSVRVLEEDRVISRPVLRELARCVVKGDDPPWDEKLVPESIHILAMTDPEGYDWGFMQPTGKGYEESEGGLTEVPAQS